MIRFTRLLLTLTLAAACSVSRGADQSVREGFDLLDQAAALRLTEPERSEQLAADAATVLEAALSPDAQLNPAAQRALGNAHLLAGDLGRAVLAYRRALLVSPSDPLARASLEHARARVEAAPVPDLSTRWRSAVRWARSMLPRRAIFWAAAAVFTLACFVLAARLIRRASARLTVPATVALVIASTALAFLGVEPRLNDPRAAVVLGRAPARTGPHAEVYPPALEQPVPPGAEVRILETRDGWAFCEIGSSRAWLPLDALERVQPTRAATSRTPSPASPPSEAEAAAARADPALASDGSPAYAWHGHLGPVHLPGSGPEARPA